MSGTEAEQIFNAVVAYVPAHQPAAIAVAGVIAVLLAFALGRASRGPAKPKRPDVAEVRHGSAGQAHGLGGAKIPALPLPQRKDLDYARRTLRLKGVSAQEGRKLHVDGVSKNDLVMAMTGLRFTAQFIAEGGHKSYTSPWREYKDLAESYLALARAHDSRACLALAYDAFHACYLNIYPEPSTEHVEREVLQHLQLLSRELAARQRA